MATVLIIDDDESFCILLKMMLEERGYAAHFVLDSRGAVAQVAARSPDIVLLDTFMHPVGGPETLQALRAGPGGTEIPVIMMSGNADPNTRASVEQAGSDAFVYKSMDLTETVQEIVASVENQLRMAAARGR